MNVNINITPSTNASKWSSVHSGDFVFLEGTTEHPISAGLYRVFIISEPGVAGIVSRNIFIVPIFDGPFSENMFPYMMTTDHLPTLTQKVSRVNIDVEVTQ